MYTVKEWSSEIKGRFLSEKKYKFLETQLKQVVTRMLSDHHLLFQQYGQPNFSEDAPVYFVEQLDDFENDSKIQTYLEHNQDRHFSRQQEGKNIGILLLCESDIEYAAPDLYYIEPKVKKIKDKWQIHGNQVKIAAFNGLGFACLASMKRGKMIGLQEKWTEDNSYKNQFLMTEPNYYLFFFAHDFDFIKTVFDWSKGSFENNQLYLMP